MPLDSKKQSLRVKLPKDVRVIAIGDIHGQLARLQELMEQVESYRVKNPVAEEHIIFLGDYVDRGPHSAQVIDYLRKRRKQAKQSNHREVFLKGNHEELLLEAYHDTGNRTELWWKNGGRETIQSYANLKQASFPGDVDPNKALTKFRKNFPKRHHKFLEKLGTQYRVGPLVFVHAGLRMDIPLKFQKEEDLCWIRGPFLNWKGPPKKYMIVHGHSITEKYQPEILEHRIGLDTGSYRRKGMITAGIFEKNKVRFISSGTLDQFESSPFSDP